MANNAAQVTKWVNLVSQNLTEALKQVSKTSKHRALRIISNGLSDDDKKRYFSTPQPASALPAPEIKEVVVVKEVAAQRETHPVYGELLADLGYKKLYATEPSKIADRSAIPIWEKQRVFRADRSQKIASDKASDSTFGFPGVISVFHMENGGINKSGIIDGQHRAEAIAILSKKGVLKIDDRIVVEVFPVASEEQVTSLFLEINKAEPVKLIDLPGAAAQDTKEIIDQAVALMEASFKGMFKSSSRCRRPNIHADTLRDELFRADIVTKYDIKSAEELQAWLLRKNEELGKLAEQDPKTILGTETKKSTSASVLKKAKDANFFLGLNWKWVQE